MSRRKGLSHEEKRQKMMELFYEKKDFFQLKELEKLGPKEKGVISQSVKDIVQSLVDDNLVDTDKIGTGVYFWAFPSKATNTRTIKMTSLETKIQECSQKAENLSTKIEEMTKGREETDERTALLNQLAELKTKKATLVSAIQKYSDCDPEVLENMRKETKIGLEAVNRWTDNIFSVKSWCKNKFFIEEANLNKQFGIPEELDYI